MMFDSSRARIPRDWAENIMETFRFSAYDLKCMRTFQNAVDILYGQVYVVRLSHCGRMEFYCKVCQKEMSNEKCVLEHSLSDAHQKKLNSIPLAKVEGTFQGQSYNYPPHTLQHKLLLSRIPAVGLQMVEGYRRNPRDEPYYRCNLCLAHGQTPGVFNHIIGKKHTEKYIRNRCVLMTSVISPVTLEVLRKRLVDVEGLKCDLIKTIIGLNCYPQKLIDAAKAKLTMKAWRMHKIDIRTEDRSSRPPSPVPGTSRSCRDTYKASNSSFTSNLESSPSSVKREGRASSSCPDQSPPRKRMFLDGASGARSADKEVQTYEMGNIIKGLKFIMETNKGTASVLQSNREAKEAIDLMFAIATVLRLNAVAEKPSPLREKKVAIFENILGEIMFSLRKVPL
ncbi:uncharacterized protein [Macrobrachium rosenbergii]|uniref:uncharacterized protein isoform X2 n=1 Tax=Macrobrachium rosenbergii TaxID=79674 RepID=UPI0034D41B98